MTIGIDLGDVWSHYCTLNEDGEVVYRSASRIRIAMEAGTHSIWVSEQLQELGHEVIVANVRELPGDLAQRSEERPSGCGEAGSLRPARSEDPASDSPSHGCPAGSSWTLIRARTQIVRLRTAAVKGGARTGQALRISTAGLFHVVLREAMHGGHAASSSRGAWPSPGTDRYYDGKDQALTIAPHQTTHGDGVSRNTSAAPGLRRRPTHGADLCPDAWQARRRFQRSRDVGCYLGLRPRRSQSGERDPQLGITKAGNTYLRSLLVECANHVLGPHGRDSTLRLWGLHLALAGR